MQVAHMAIVTPRKCGLYETTRELVCGLRDIDLDSRLVDPLPEKNPIGWRGEQDRGAPVDSIDWAKDSDIFVNHSGLGNLENINKPIVHVAHGRPRHSFLSEVEGSTPIYSYHYANNKKKKFKSIVTFWEEHVPYLQVMYPDKKVCFVQSSVDLEYWSPGETDYDFGGHAGEINIVCSDAFRNDVDCYEALNAYALWARKDNRDTKLHIFGKPKNMRGWGALIKRIQDDGNMGLVQGWAADLRPVYRAADLVLTSHEINVRTVREAMACGCPVVRTQKASDYHRINEGLLFDKIQIRKQAYEKFNPRNTALQFNEVLNDALH